MTLNDFRSLLYKSAKYLGDINAIKRNKVKRRVGYRIAGKLTSKLLNSIFK